MMKSIGGGGKTVRTAMMVEEADGIDLSGGR
jgi:hypothetical protein